MFHLSFIISLQMNQKLKSQFDITRDEKGQIESMKKQVFYVLFHQETELKMAKEKVYFNPLEAG